MSRSRPTPTAGPRTGQAPGRYRARPASAPDAAPSWAVDLQGVAVTRGGAGLVHDVSWRVRTGEHWAVIGPNGCGKTTLLEIVAGWQHPSAGRVCVLGRRFGECDLEVLRGRIGWVSRALEEQIRPRLSCLGVVLTGRTAGLGVWDEPGAAELGHARRLLETVGCTSLQDLPFEVVSQGERTRVLLARALVTVPALLVLDEPCTGLDPVGREGVLAALERLTRRADSPVLLYVTHHIDEVIPAIGHVLALRAGRVAACGPKADVLTAAVLQRVFGCRFRVSRHGARYHARALAPATAHWLEAPG